jgi:hypothetical protein
MSVADLGKQTGVFLDAARKRPELANLFTSFNAQVPQVQVRAGPGKGTGPRNPDQRRVCRPVRRNGRCLRERLQPVRPTLPRVRAGRAGVPSAAGRHRAVLCPEHDDEPDGAAFHPDDDQAGFGH